MSSWLTDLATGAARVVDLAAAEVVLSSIVAGVVGLICLALGRRWPALQYALWILVLVRLVLPPGLAHPLAAGALLSKAGGSWLHSGNADESVFAGGVPTGAREPGRPRAEPMRLALSLAWLAGVAWLWVRDRTRMRALRGVLADAAPVTDPLAQRLVGRWRRRLGIRRRVRIVSSPRALSPFTDGVFRPVVFLPAPLLERDHRRALAAAISHELAHVARFDVLALRAERLVTRLYFFHPVVWLASRRLHALREGLTDALATSKGILSPHLYVAGLLDLLQRDLQGVEASPSLTPSQGRILMRLEAVLARSRRVPRPVPALVAAAVLGLFLLPLADASAPADGAAPQGGVSLADPLPSGKVTRRFGKSPSPVGRGVEDHAGIDLAGPRGTPVLAAEAGVVELAQAEYQSSPAAGTVVILDHGQGRKTFYSHLSSLDVREGQKVTRGQVIGAVGNTGVSTGPHLHFEVWQDAVHVDPAQAIPALARR